MGSLKEGASGLDAMLEARKVAVIGVSTTPGKMGYQVVDRAIGDGYSGELVLVNPKGGLWRDRPLVSEDELADCPVAVLAVPAERSLPAIRAAAAKGVSYFVALPAGFGEAGRKDLDAELRQIVSETGVRILGPNCLGFFSATNRLNLTSMARLPVGTVAMASQSGGIVGQAARRFRRLGEGFDSVVTVGNQLDVTLPEVVDTLAGRSTAGSLLLYLESFEGDDLLEAIAKYASTRPVVVLMGGRSAASRRAAASHTGSMFGQWARIKALLEDAGAYVTGTIEVAVAAACQGSGAMSGRRIFTVCDGGGHSVLLADALDRERMRSPEPGEGLRERLAELIDRPASVVTNPLDLAGAADTDVLVYARVARAVVDSGEYDGLAVAGIIGSFADSFGPQAAQQELDMADQLTEVRGSCPIAVQSPAAGDGGAALQTLRDGGIPVLEWPTELAAWFGAHAAGARPDEVPPGPAHQPVDPTLSESTEVVRRVVAELGVGDGIGAVVGAEDLAAIHDGRWVLRADGFPHKRDVGAIHVGVTSDRLAALHRELADLAASAGLPSVVRLAPLIEHEHEFVLTVWGNSHEGQGIALGGGGSAVESRADIALGRVPRSPSDVLTLLRRTRAGADFLAHAPEDQVSRLADFVLRFSGQITTTLGRFSEIELNPVAVGPAGVSVLDALPRLKDTTPTSERPEQEGTA